MHLKEMRLASLSLLFLCLILGGHAHTVDELFPYKLAREGIDRGLSLCDHHRCCICFSEFTEEKLKQIQEDYP
ncbi:hypothetical protein PRIPAC_96630 [Pristionchus pacificus]|uniref:Uncharacterized protein n=1 Tax=Pristionchus pacificus TaxID=54126 RepID=A0A2A6BIN8_PRIPA|nr:hypothetical protein PRIPAC_96630 [Pristionchus pacificus]|eukprot:PDM65770.1 hypothetical protein PRIPAC_45171 [Pristionchus pacificus]